MSSCQTVVVDVSSRARVNKADKGKPGQSQERKATGPRFLRETHGHPKDRKIAGLPKRNAATVTLAAPNGYLSGS